MLRTALRQDDLANALLGAARHGYEHIVHLLLEAGQHPLQPRAQTPAMALSLNVSACHTAAYLVPVVPPCVALRHATYRMSMQCNVQHLLLLSAPQPAALNASYRLLQYIHCTM